MSQCCTSTKTTAEFLEQVALQEIPDVQVSSSAAVVVQEQLIVQSLPGARVPRQRVQQRIVVQVVDPRVSQMVDVPVLGRISSVVSERIVEQVADVLGSRGATSRGAHSQQIFGSGAAALEASQGQDQGFFFFFFRTFPKQKKCEGWPPVDSGTGAALQLMDAGGL